MFLSNVALANVAESSLWESRSQGRKASDRSKATVLASLPTLALPLPARQIQNASPTNAVRFADRLPFPVQLPLSEGSVRRISLPAGKARKIVVHIQDIHLNAEAQGHISAALRDMCLTRMFG